MTAVPGDVPESLAPLVEGARGLDAAWFGARREKPRRNEHQHREKPRRNEHQHRDRPRRGEQQPGGAAGDPDTVRRAAVLMLFADDREHPDVLLTERAPNLRAHAGQVSFPGGRLDEDDGGPVQAAVREAEEETGLDPAGVVPLAVLPELHIPPTGFLVTPVLAHWARPAPVRAVDPGETARVLRVPVPVLTDPANRFTLRGPRGHAGPAFRTSGLVVWGFTAGLLSALLHRSGWERPWDATRIETLDHAWAVAREDHRDLRGERVSDPADVPDGVRRWA